MKLFVFKTGYYDVVIHAESYDRAWELFKSEGYSGEPDRIGKVECGENEEYVEGFA